MAETIVRGPVAQLGPLLGTPSSPDVFDGPSINYQGECLPDVRWTVFNKDSLNAGRFPGFLDTPFITMTDQIPSAYGTATIAALQHTAAATAVNLVTVCPGGATVSTYFSTQCTAIVPLIPYVSGGGFPNQGTPVNVLALDFGFSVGTVTAGSGTVSAIPDLIPFDVGQWIIIGGAGNAAKTLPLVTQIQSINVAASTIVVSPVSSASLTAAPIGSANFYGSVTANQVANAANPYVGVGLVAAFNPTESLARGVSITASSGSAPNITWVITGYDVYGQVMHETIACVPGTAVTTYGKKAFKYILSAVPATTDSTYNWSVGTSDVFGLHIRSDKWEYTNTCWNGSFLSASTGWLAANRTNPAVYTSGAGDVRGTYQMSAIGGGTNATTTSSNGTARLITFTSVPLAALTQATPLTTISMFGSTQA